MATKYNWTISKEEIRHALNSIGEDGTVWIVTEIHFAPNHISRQIVQDLGHKYVMYIFDYQYEGKKIKVQWKRRALPKSEVKPVERADWHQLR